MYASFQRKENAALIVPDISQDGGTIGGLNSVNNLSTVDAAETKTTSRQYKSVKDNVNHVGETMYINIYIYPLNVRSSILKKICRSKINVFICNLSVTL